jgi:hypothetical protein
VETHTLSAGRTLCEHVFVTAQGSPLTRYRRAIESRSLALAELAAREATYLSLPDALGLLALYAAAEDPKYARAAARWLGRLGLEQPELGLAEMQLAAAALAALPTLEETAMRVLVELSRASSGRYTPSRRG